MFTQMFNLDFKIKRNYVMGVPPPHKLRVTTKKIHIFVCGVTLARFKVDLSV